MMDLKYPSDIEAMAKLDPVVRAEFEKWMLELDGESAKRDHPYGIGPLSEVTGVECWLWCFEDGMSPSEAIDEDLSNG